MCTVPIRTEHGSFGEHSFDHTRLTGVLEFNAEHLTIESCAFQGVDGTTGIRINSKTCQINSSNAFHGHANLCWFYVSDHTQLNINGNFLYHCAKIEAFVAPATTTVSNYVSFNNDVLFVRCPNLIIYTPESSGLHAYAKKQFLRCVPEQYAEMSALLAVANQ